MAEPEDDELIEGAPVVESGHYAFGEPIPNTAEEAPKPRRRRRAKADDDEPDEEEVPAGDTDAGFRGEVH